MILDQKTPLSIRGAFKVPLRCASDQRGLFVRLFEQTDGAGPIPAPLVQWSLSCNPAPKTTRGLHYQASPHDEGKWVVCLRGSVFDVLLDLRPRSKTFGQVASLLLSEKEPMALWIPKGCAHGFQTLVPDSWLLYGIDARYHPESASGYHWQSPDLGIKWPHRSGVLLSDRDDQWAPFSLKHFVLGWAKRYLMPPGYPMESLSVHQDPKFDRWYIFVDFNLDWGMPFSFVVEKLLENGISILLHKKDVVEFYKRFQPKFDNAFLVFVFDGCPNESTIGYVGRVFKEVLVGFNPGIWI